MDPHDLPDVTQGAEVVSADGGWLGTVAEVADISFRVEEPKTGGFWLGRDYVIDSGPDRVTMSFGYAELNGYTLMAPGMSPAQDIKQDPHLDTLIPDEERHEQRVRMEEELAEQRRRMTRTRAGEAPAGGTLGETVEDELRAEGIDPTREAPASDSDTERWSPAGSYVEPEDTATDAPKDD